MRTSRTVLVTLTVLAACHVAPPAPSVANTTPPPPPPTAVRGALPLLYDDLFVDGKTWSFPGRAEKRQRDELGVEYATDFVHATITCRMSNVMVIRGGKRGQLDCTADRSDFPLTNAPSGLMVGTRDGLWQLQDEFNNDISTLDPRFIVLPPHPAEGRREIVDDGWSQSIETFKVAGGYCYNYRFDGEWEGWQLCIRAGDGIIGGAGFYLGAGAELFQFGEYKQI